MCPRAEGTFADLLLTWVSHQGVGPSLGFTTLYNVYKCTWNYMFVLIYSPSLTFIEVLSLHLHFQNKMINLGVVHHFLAWGRHILFWNLDEKSSGVSSRTKIKSTVLKDILDMNQYIHINLIRSSFFTFFLLHLLVARCGLPAIQLN